MEVPASVGMRERTPRRVKVRVRARMRAWVGVRGVKPVLVLVGVRERVNDGGGAR